MARVMIVSDIRLYCEGLAEILGHLSSIRVVGTARNFDDAVEVIKERSPDVVLLDMTMRGSCQAIRHVTESCPNTKIVALAVPEDENNILTCAEAGVAGYVAREASLDELLCAVKGAITGELYCPPRIAATLFRKIKSLTGAISNSPTKKTPSGDTSATPLTRREQQIAALVAEGLSNKHIARNLGIEVSTVKNHVHSILVKMGVESRTQAAFILRDIQSSQFNESLDLDPSY